MHFIRYAMTSKKWRHGLWPLAFIMYSVLIFADSYQDTTTADFTAGNPDSTDVVTDAVQMAATDNWSATAQNWWNASWSYRRLITIENPNASALSDYQVKITNPVYDETELIASWHLDGGQSGSISNNSTTGLQDSSGNINHGTASNANGTGMAWTAGRPDGAVNFDGSDDYINVTAVSNIPTGGTPFSMMAWIKPDVHNGARAIVSWGSAVGNQANCLRLAYGETGAGNYDLKHYFWGNDLIVNVGNLSGTWHHVAVTYDGSNRKMYLNGQLIGSNTPGAVNVASTAVQIGRSLPAGGEYFDGSIDEVRIYKKLLSQEEINALYDARAKLNYSDMRFTKSDGITEINTATSGGHWLEKDGTVWVKIPGSTPSGLSYIYIYYGNSSASSVSSGQDTFDFFDDFSVDLSKWTLTQSTGGNVQIVNGETRLTGNTNWNTNGMASNSNIARPAVIEWYSRTSTTTIDTFEGYSVNPLNYNSGLVIKRNSGGASLIRRLDGVDYTNGTHTTARTLQRIVLKPASGYTVYWNNAQMEDNTTWATATDKITFQIYSTAPYLYVDDVRARKYAAAEPVTAVYAEQEYLKFAYRKSITLNNTSGIALTDHQVKIVLNYNSSVAGEVNLEASAGEVKQDFGDVRFGNDSGKIYPCWRESFIANTKATYWVKIPSIPVSGTTFYAYYGSSSAGNPSNFNAVFVKDYGDSNLEGLWHMDDAAGSAVADTSGKGRHGSIAGSVPWQSIDGGQWSTKTDAKFSWGTHLYFNNSASNYVSGNYITASPNTFTMEIWAKPEKTVTVVGESTTGTGGVSGQSYAIFAVFDPGSDAGAGISVGTNAIQVFEHASGYLPALLSYGVALSGWNHIAVVYTNKQPKLYLNGTLVRTGLTSTRNNVYPSYYFSDGGSNYGPFQGYLDEARIYNRALDANEIKAHSERRKYASAEPAVSGTGTKTAWNAKASSWPYRKVITIDNSTGSSQSNYQLLVTANTQGLISSGRLSRDCSDLRFSPTNSFNEEDWSASYPFWIESGKNTTTTKIWVKTDSLPVSVKTIYMYYGNTSAVNVNSGAATFNLFDDFDNGIVDAYRWETVGSGGTFEEVNNYFHANSNANNWRGIRSIPNFGTNYILEYQLEISGDMGSQGTGFHGFYDQAAGTPPAQATAIDAAYRHTGFGEGWISDWYTNAEQANGTNREGNNTSINMSGVIDRATIKWYGTGTYYYLYRNPTTYTATLSTYPPSTVNHDVFFGVCDINASFGGIDLKVYWAFLRKYAAVEPSVTVASAEQLPYKSSGTFTSAVKNTGADSAEINSISWNTSGSGTITMQVRAGNTTGWTDSSPAWENVVNGDTSIASSGKYIQYKASITGTGATAEPVLLDVTIGFNHQPGTPANITPANGASPDTISPVLSSDAFYDPDTADTHTSSQWQITSTPGDYSTPAYDSGETLSNLTSITIPAGTIDDDGTMYYWHVRHRDNQGSWSSYSTETSFAIPTPSITAAFLYDSDYDNQVDVLQVNLSEDILGTTSSATTGTGFALTDGGSFSYSIASGTETAAGTIKFLLNEKGTADSVSSFILNYSSVTGNLVDVDGTASKIASVSSMAVTANTLIISNFVSLDTDGDGRLNTLTFTFNNTVTSAGDIADWNITDADGSTNLLSGLTNAAISFNQNKITIILPDSAGTNGIPSYQYTPNGTNDINDTNGFIPYQFSSAADMQSPLSPLPVAPANGSVIQNSGIAFAWTSVTDATGIVYDIEIDDSSAFSLPLYAAANGLASPTTDAVFQDGTYYWRVKAVDGNNNESGWSATWTFAVSLQDTGGNNNGNDDNGNNSNDGDNNGNNTGELPVSSALIADAGDNASMNPTVVFLDGSKSVDTGNTLSDLSYEWIVLSTPSPITPSSLELLNASSVQPSFTAITAGDYTVQLIVSTSYAASYPDTVTVTINNAAPFADAGPDRTLYSGPVITLDGSASADPNNDELSYKWEQVSGTAVYLQNSTGITADFSSANITGALQFRLTVTDTAGNTDTDTIYIILNSQNDTVPVANAGVTQIVPAGIPAQLNAVLSTDNQQTISYFWSQVSGPQNVTLSNENSAAPTFIPQESGVYVFQLVVSDGTSYSTPATVNVAVNSDSNGIPKASAKVLFPANGVPYAGQQVILSASESADPDGDILSYSWKQTYGLDVLLTETNGEYLIFYPVTADNYKFMLTVSDGTAEGIPVETNLTVVPDENSSAPSAEISIDPVLDPDGDFRVFSSSGMIKLDGSASAGEGTLKFFWTGIYGTSVIITGETEPVMAFKPQVAGTYGFRLTVTDANGLHASGEIFFAVDTVLNGVPYANAGEDFLSAVNNTVQLDASFSSDPLWDPDSLETSGELTFMWEQTAGLPVVLYGAQTKNPYFVPHVTGEYKFKVYALDGQSISMPDEVIVTVKATALTTPSTGTYANYSAMEDILLTEKESGDASADDETTDARSKGCFIKQLKWK